MLIKKSFSLYLKDIRVREFLISELSGQVLLQEMRGSVTNTVCFLLRLQSFCTNVMASVNTFVSLGGQAYAVTVKLDNVKEFGVCITNNFLWCT